MSSFFNAHLMGAERFYPAQMAVPPQRIQALFVSVNDAGFESGQVRFNPPRESKRAIAGYLGETF